MSRRLPVYRAHPRLAVMIVVTVTLATSVATMGWGVQQSTEPVAFKPDPRLRGRAVAVPKGTTLLFAFIQRLADFTGRPTYYLGADSLDATIPVERALTAVDTKSARAVLDAAGYELSEELYRGDKVLWVQRRVEPTRRRGALRRSDDGGAVAAQSASTDPVSVFERREGAGARFLVTFEATTREEAEDAALLLRSLKRGKER